MKNSLYYLQIFNGFVKTFKGFVKTSRPRFWIYLIGPYLIGIIAWSQVTEATDFFGIVIDFTFMAFLLYFSYPANLLVYGVNDLFDYETDKLNPKKSDYESVMTPDKKMVLWSTIILLNIPFLFLDAWPNFNVYLRLFLFVLSSIFYSAPPLRAKAKPLLDTIVSAFVYISPWFVWYYISWWSGFDWMIFASLLARNMAMHAYSAIPDIDADSKAWLQTVATFCGKKGTLWFCILCYLLATLCSISNLWRFSFIGLVYIIMMVFSFQFTLFRLYKIFPWINAGVGFILFWYVLSLKLGT